jgi:hypothetical protein
MKRTEGVPTGAKNHRWSYFAKCSSDESAGHMKHLISIFGAAGFQFRRLLWRWVRSTHSAPRRDNDIPAHSARLANTTLKALFLYALEPPDLAIEMPDFDIAALDELASGLQRILVGICIDRSVRWNPIVLIDEVGPIGPHDVLLREDNARGNNAWERGAMQEPAGTHMTGNRIEIIEAQRYCESEIRQPGRWVMDIASLKEQAERCRRLARHADPFTQQRLLDLAAEYDAKIAQLEPKPSAASRLLRNDEL